MYKCIARAYAFIFSKNDNYDENDNDDDDDDDDDDDNDDNDNDNDDDGYKWGWLQCGWGTLSGKVYEETQLKRLQGIPRSGKGQGSKAKCNDQSKPNKTQLEVNIKQRSA